MRPYNAKEKPYLTKKTRNTYIEKCRAWTFVSDDPDVPNGMFPLDNHIKFEDLSNQELLDYHECYVWAANPKNFNHIHTKKGG